MFAAALLLAGCGPALEEGDSGDVIDAVSDGVSSRAPACPSIPLPGYARCHSWIKTDGANPNASSPSGLGAVDIQSAYGLSATGGGGRLVAIVDAYHYPEAEADLAVFRSYYGLPPCTKANGCFQQVNQNGVAGSYPRSDSGWILEEALDLDAVSSACPGCRIVLVEATSNSFANLGTAVNTAAAMGAVAISNSYGGGEYSAEASDQNTYFNHPGIAITVSSGDSGYGVEFPAASNLVTAVGGTKIVRASNARGWTETAWSGAGSGCSAYVSKPSFQTDTGCSRRSVADVSADADPNSGLSLYDSHGYQGLKGWITVGGTSLAAPIVAGVYAQAGTGLSNANPYSHTSSLWDITSGSNGSCGNYLCNAGAGFDGPTGLGSPNGSGAF
ncbi:MAG TPA: S53 family peptidase [Myxococcales bacterium]|nr:S53 family peptidase [Myxococcales bacterium]